MHTLEFFLIYGHGLQRAFPYFALRSGKLHFVCCDFLHIQIA